MLKPILYLLTAVLLSACSADSVPETPTANTPAATGAAEQQPAPTPASGAAAADAPAADPTAGVLPDEPCQVLSATDAGAALGVTGTLQAVTNHNDVKGKCLYQTPPDAQGAYTTPLTLEWTRDVASQSAYTSTKKGLDLINLKPELVSGLGREAFWGIDSELYVQLPGGMLMVQAVGNSPAEKRARNLKVAQLVVPRL